MSQPEFPQFSTPHCHPHSLDSGSTPEAFALREVALGSKTITCTDHGTLAAAYQIFKVAKKGPDGYNTEARKWPGLIPVVGLEAYFRDDDDPILKKLGVPRTSERPRGVDADEWASQHPDGLSYFEYLKYMHATLHFCDYPAYLAAVRMLSKADARAERHGSERKPLFSWPEIEELAAMNVTMGSSCLIGMVQRHLMVYQDLSAATAYFDRLHHLFKDRFFVEAFPHRCTHNYVDAVFLNVVDAAGVEQKMRYYPGKHLKLVDVAGNTLEIYANEMANFWKTRGSKQAVALAAVMNYRKWDDLPAPLKIAGVDTAAGFVQNECAPHAPEGDVQWGCNKFVIEMARRRGVPVMVSDDSHFALPEEKVVQDIRLTTPGHTWLFHNSYHRQSSQEAFEYFRRYQDVTAAEFHGWVENSLAWAERFKGFKFDSTPKLPNKFFPEDTLAHTRHLIQVHGRLAGKPAEMERLSTEIDILHRNGKIDLLPYFFVDEEVCHLYAINRWITGPGRGSAAGVLFTKLLGITHLDPLDYELSLERFITPDRIVGGKLPDIDQDLPFREPLEGWDTDVVEFLAVDGTKHVVPEKMKFWTTGKPMTADEAAAAGAEFMAWWLMAPMKPVKVAQVLRRSRGQTARSDSPDYLAPHYQGWLKARYGDHVAQMSVDHSLKLKNAVKDVHRARHGGNVPAEIHAWCKQFEEAPQGLPDHDFVVGYENDEGVHPGSITRDKALQDYAATYPEDFEVVKKALGLARHKGSHPCGFVLADRPIHEFIPLMRVNDKTVTAYTAAGVEASGGVKMDFLVVNSIRDIQSAMDIIRERHGVGVDPPALVPEHHLVRTAEGKAADVWDLPKDQEVFKDFLSGNVATVFQYHTQGARDWMRHFARNRKDGTPMIADIRDLAVFTALDRPGPLDIKLGHPDAPDQKHNALVEYTRRAAGKPGTPDILPIMDLLLPKTHGVMVFQEQLQYTYQQLTGCGGPEAEEFRSNVAKKLKVKVDAAYPGFMDRASVKLGSREAAQGAWDMFSTWGQYGFNLAHATCYAVIGYACAYLKHHYPLEWWCGLLRNADKAEVNTEFWPHVRHWVDLPDVGVSGDNWEIQGPRLVAPLTLATGIGPAAHDQLRKYAPYRSVADLAAAIRKHVVDGARNVSKFDKKTNKEKVVRQMGRSSIHRSTVYRLAVAGCLRSLFPEGTAVAEQVGAFDVAMAALDPKYTKAKMLPLPKLDDLERYQVIKSVLAPYGNDLRDLVAALCYEMPEGRVVTEDGRGYRLLSYKWDHDARVWEPTSDRVVSGNDLQAMADATSLPDGGYRTAVVAFVEEARRFRWGENKVNEAVELLLEVGGRKFKVVKWGDDTGRLPAEVDSWVKGAVLTAILYRGKPERGFAIRNAWLARAPYQPPVPEKKSKKTQEKEETDEPEPENEPDDDQEETG